MVPLVQTGLFVEPTRINLAIQCANEITSFLCCASLADLDLWIVQEAKRGKTICSPTHIDTANTIAETTVRSVVAAHCLSPDIEATSYGKEEKCGEEYLSLDSSRSRQQEDWRQI